MTTKDQERKALEQIKEIVDGLGPDSYVGTAFEGCFKDAEENIENDFALSMNGRWKYAEQKIEEYDAELSRKERKIAGMTTVLKELQDHNKQLIEDRNHERNLAMNRADMLVEKTRVINRLLEESEKHEQIIAERDREIIELKAKLYDAMMKGGEHDN